MVNILDASVPRCFLRASGKVGSFISVSIVILGVAAFFQTHIGGFSLAVESDVLERICDGVSVSQASRWLARLPALRLVTWRMCGTC